MLWKVIVVFRICGDDILKSMEAMAIMALGLKESSAYASYVFLS